MKNEPIRAYPVANGKYRLRGETYHRRKTLAKRGAIWTGKCWECTREQAEGIAIFMVWACVGPHCHMPEQNMWITEEEFNRGETNKLGCPACDTMIGCGERAKVFGVGQEGNPYPDLFVR